LSSAQQSSRPGVMRVTEALERKVDRTSLSFPVGQVERRERRPVQQSLYRRHAPRQHLDAAPQPSDLPVCVEGAPELSAPARHPADTESVADARRLRSRVRGTHYDLCGFYVELDHRRAASYAVTKNAWLAHDRTAWRPLVRRWGCCDTNAY
jgi:hypothetical protein